METPHSTPITYRESLTRKYKYENEFRFWVVPKLSRAVVGGKVTKYDSHWINQKDFDRVKLSKNAIRGCVWVPETS